jgi:hypothetical protein
MLQKISSQKSFIWESENDQKKGLKSLSLLSPLAHLIVIAPNLHQEQLQTHNATTTWKNIVIKNAIETQRMKMQMFSTRDTTRRVLGHQH